MYILSISSLKGGVGKTSTLLGLASAAANKKIPTLVIDLDPHADASTGLKIVPKNIKDIAEILVKAEPGSLTKAITRSGWFSNAILDVAVSSRNLGLLEYPEISRKSLNKLWITLENINKYELILIDCPPSLSGLTHMAWMASDSVLIITEPNLFSVSGAQRTAKAVKQFSKQFDIDLQIKGILVNKFSANVPEHVYRLKEIKEIFSQKMFTEIIPNETQLQQLQGATQPIHLWPREETTKIAQSYENILQKILSN